MRFLAVFSCLVLVAVGGALSGLLGPASYAELQRQAGLLYLEDYFAHLPLALTPGRWLALQTVVFGTFGGSLLLAGALLRHAANRRELRRLGREARRALAALRRTAAGLSRGEKWVAGALLGLVLALRLLLLLRYGFRYDELVSYLFFVREGAVVISSYYPLPNNHIFFNLCAAALRQLPGLSPLLVMRLPSLLAATLGTALSYALLTRFSNFRVATLVTGLFNLAPPALYYAASGRGYYLQFVLMQLGFFALVGLASRPRYRRLGWAVFIGSSILGLYTIPTYAYPLASLLLGAGLVLGPRPARLGAQGPLLLLAAAVIGGAALLLYAPVGAVSGWPRLLGNSYVDSADWATFRTLALANIYEKVNEQFGLVRPVLVLGAALLLGAPVALRRLALPATLRSLGWVSWAMLTAPMALVVAQRAYPPVRAVVYLTYFSWLLAALALLVLARRWPRWHLPRPAQWGLIGATVLLAAGLRLGSVLGRISSSQREEVQLTQAWHWLQARRPGRVFAGSYPLFFYYYAVQARQSLVLADQPRPGRRYDYLVLPPRQATVPAWTGRLRYRAVFRNDLVSIFALVPASR